jgi:hypothetical protein
MTFDILTSIPPIRRKGDLDMPGTRQRRIVGAILKVPLDERRHTYAQTLNEADFAFFDARTDKELPIHDIISRPVLFREAVHKSAWNTGRWKRVGKAPLTPELSKPVPKFIQDKLQPDRFSIYLGGDIRPATKEECVGLQQCSVWDGPNIEERLRDHYAGRPQRVGRINYLVEQIRHVLLRDWNPKNLARDGARKAYDAYISGITAHIESKASNLDRLAKHLYVLETLDLQVDGDLDRCQRAAAKLLELREER